MHSYFSLPSDHGFMTRKAYGIWMERNEKIYLPYEIVYGPSASQIKGRYMRDMDEIGMEPKDFFKDIRIKRAKNCDKLIPTQHPVCKHLTQEQIAIISHAFNNNKRSHYVTRESDLNLLKLTYEFGIFQQSNFEISTQTELDYDRKTLLGGDTVYHLTEFGRFVAGTLVSLYPQH